MRIFRSLASTAGVAASWPKTPGPASSNCDQRRRRLRHRAEIGRSKSTCRAVSACAFVAAAGAATSAAIADSRLARARGHAQELRRACRPGAWRHARGSIVRRSLRLRQSSWQPPEVRLLPPRRISTSTATSSGSPASLRAPSRPNIPPGLPSRPCTIEEPPSVPVHQPGRRQPHAQEHRGPGHLDHQRRDRGGVGRHPLGAGDLFDRELVQVGGVRGEVEQQDTADAQEYRPRRTPPPGRPGRGRRRSLAGAAGRGGSGGEASVASEGGKTTTVSQGAAGSYSIRGRVNRIACRSLSLSGIIKAAVRAKR